MYFLFVSVCLIIFNNNDKTIASSVFAKYLKGHSDAVWKLALVENTLVSASADGSIRLWNPFADDNDNNESLQSLHTLNNDKSGCDLWSKNWKKLALV